MSYAQAVQLHEAALAEADAAAIEYRAARAAWQRSHSEVRRQALHTASADLDRLSDKARALQTACETEHARELKAAKAGAAQAAADRQPSLFDPVQCELF